MYNDGIQVGEDNGWSSRVLVIKEEVNHQVRCRNWRQRTLWYRRRQHGVHRWRPLLKCQGRSRVPLKQREESEGESQVTGLDLLPLCNKRQKTTFFFWIILSILLNLTDLVLISQDLIGSLSVCGKWMEGMITKTYTMKIMLSKSTHTHTHTDRRIRNYIVNLYR